MNWFNKLACGNNKGQGTPELAKKHPRLIQPLWNFHRNTHDERQAAKKMVLAGLKQKHFELEERGTDDLTPLHLAARCHGDAELVEALIESGHPVSPTDRFGNTPLVLAIAEQDRLEGNLPVIQILLARSKDRDLLIKPSRFGCAWGIYDFAKSHNMQGTVALISHRFRRLDVDAVLHDLPDDLVPKRLSEVLYYQERTWKEIAHEMRVRGVEDGLVSYHLCRLGAWTAQLEHLKIKGNSDEECVNALLELGASWEDISSAYQKQGYPPEEIISILMPSLQRDPNAHALLPLMIAGAISAGKTNDLVELRMLLEGMGENPREIFTRTPFVQARKENILQRMQILV